MPWKTYEILVKVFKYLQNDHIIPWSGRNQNVSKIRKENHTTELISTLL